MRLHVTAATGASVQDLGRDRAHQGVATGGARDQHAARLANALTGKPPGAPLAEVVLGELAVVPDRDALAAVTGACAVTLAGVEVRRGVPLLVPAGAELRLRVVGGVAGYLAVAGRWQVPPAAGGSGPDPGLGITTALTAGRVVAVAEAPATLDDPVLGIGLVHPGAPERPEEPLAVIALLPGPDLRSAVREALTGGPFTVDPRSDDVGVRVTGALPDGPSPGGLPSRGVPVGAVELPGAPGELIVLQRRRSLTAGYPVVAIAGSVAQDRVGQLRPGDTVRFAWTTTAESRTDLRRRREFETRTRTRVENALLARAQNDWGRQEFPVLGARK